VMEDQEIQILQESDENNSFMWQKLISARVPIVLPRCYRIGTCFVSDPQKTSKQAYKRLCTYMRTELVLLIERLHCIYIQAFSRRDCRTKWWKFGVIRNAHARAVREDPMFNYIHDNLFLRYIWPGLNLIQRIQNAYSSVENYISSQENPVMARETYCDEGGQDQIINSISNDDFLLRLHMGINDEQAATLSDIKEVQLGNLCHDFITAMTQENEKRLSSAVMDGHSGEINLPLTLVDTPNTVNTATGTESKVQGQKGPGNTLKVATAKRKLPMGNRNKVLTEVHTNNQKPGVDEEPNLVDKLSDEVLVSKKSLTRDKTGDDKAMVLDEKNVKDSDEGSVYKDTDANDIEEETTPQKRAAKRTKISSTPRKKTTKTKLKITENEEESEKHIELVVDAMTGDFSDDDSYIQVQNKVAGKPIFDLEKDELIIADNAVRTRKTTNTWINIRPVDCWVGCI
jgi:hypothetical protein